MFEFIEIPSYVTLTSDDSSEPVSFVKVEAKDIFRRSSLILMVAR